MTLIAPIRSRVRRVARPRIVVLSRPATVFDVFDSDLGWIAVAAVARHLVGVTFGHPSNDDAAAALVSYMRRDAATRRSDPPAASHDAAECDASAWLADLRERFRSFAAGAFEDFRDVELDESHLTPFEQSVVHSCRAIPYGQTLTYGQLAAKVGRRGAARAVGRVMATNRYPLVVPCHRVLAAGGRLGGYSAPQGLAMKRRLLAMEAGVSGESVRTARPK